LLPQFELEGLLPRGSIAGIDEGAAIVLLSAGEFSVEPEAGSMRAGKNAAGQSRKDLEAVFVAAGEAEGQLSSISGMPFLTMSMANSR
jgi:hypothetical protein